MDFTSFVLQFGFCIYKILIHKSAESIDFTMIFKQKQELFWMYFLRILLIWGTPLKAKYTSGDILFFRYQMTK